MINNIRKTISYARRNGVGSAVVAAMERLRNQRDENYLYKEPTEEELEKQRKWYRALLNNAEKSRMLPLISILVPCYNTDREFFKEMIESVKNQTYGKWELILAEAPVVSKGKAIYPLTDIIESYSGVDGRIRHICLKSNAGISENSNAALDASRGDYMALLDHDDVLTKDALCEVAIAAIKNYPRLIYSDEDKCNADGTRFFDYHRKKKFNPDLFMSNNYICHFTTIRSDVIHTCRFRGEYDGAQDYDLFLRAVGRIMWSSDYEKQIVHIPKVLYHWRSHDGSTSGNPQSKMYAYEAGARALRDFLKASGIKATVSHLKHVGFYRVSYDDILEARKDIGVIGGRITDKNGTLIGGNYRADGKVRYKDLPRGFSGGLQHLAVLEQDTDAVDIRCMRIRSDLLDLYKQIFGIPYDMTLEGKAIDVTSLGTEEELRDKCIRFGQAVRQLGYKVLWDPNYETTI
ncbi:Glycosyltransferase involved in cell wall bisynthesis [Butyrivibrio sp. ob235]|uniref:glycosyltransferase n=1 Tax=Butyrivibrio sp. ob235 TaxID=1761780 RepID=UPI0008B10A45|nr:glycosyltransferase [Butyrivibrio sp. ob235]SEM49442.1 Glycosyltransferase involved in cell wall bisynthesis [Butyrivibrio sp. ob235]